MKPSVNLHLIPDRSPPRPSRCSQVERSSPSLSSPLALCPRCTAGRAKPTISLNMLPMFRPLVQGNGKRGQPVPTCTADKGKPTPPSYMLPMLRPLVQEKTGGSRRKKVKLLLPPARCKLAPFPKDLQSVLVGGRAIKGTAIYKDKMWEKGIEVSFNRGSQGIQEDTKRRAQLQSREPYLRLIPSLGWTPPNEKEEVESKSHGQLPTHCSPRSGTPGSNHL